MTVTILQTDIVWADYEENIRRAELLLQTAPKSDMYVLPEMWSTGFMTESVVDDKQATLRWMQKTASRCGAAVCGSVPTTVAPLQEEGRPAIVNRFYFVCPNGKTEFYDKRHLFTFGGEDKVYTAGRERKIVEFGGLRFLLLTCYDLRFPVWSRNQGDFDAIIYIASWPDARIKAWDILLRARAIENQCFVIAANRIGTDDKNLYPGHSVVLDAKGNEISCYYAENQQIMTADVDKDALFAFRNKFRVLDDGDSFIIT